MAWIEHEHDSGQRFVPFYCDERKEMHISHCWLYELDEYWGHPLSTSGYMSEEEAIDAMRTGHLPREVEVALDKYCAVEGHTYRGLLD